MSLKITDNIWCLGNRLFHFFVVGGQDAILVEGAVSGAVANLSRQWPALCPQPEVETIIAMHAHFDHICGIPHLLDLFPQARVAAAPYAAQVMQKEKVLKGFFEQDQKMVGVLREMGLLDQDVQPPQPQAIPVEIILRDGDILNSGDGCSLEIIAAPGHSPCSLGAYMPEDKVLFVSDVAGFQISDKELFPIFFQGYEMYMDSIHRMQGYAARIVAPAHGALWSGEHIPAFYERALQAARGAFDWIRAMSEAGIEHQQMADKLFKHYYRGDLCIYTPENINLCVNLLIKRVQECL
jgi:glyoxylase-like metal-dependent hydrolase (beta-lactamase superfamily II)